MSMLAHPSSCEVISGNQILGQDLAKALPVFSGVPGDAVIGLSPVPGASRVLSFPELQGLGAKYGVRVPREAEACFQWQMQVITEDAVRAVIREALQSVQARVEILAMSKPQAPAGKLVFPLSGLSASASTDPATPVTWRGEVEYGGSRKFAVWARVRVSATTTRVVATQLLLPSHAVSGQQVRLETCDEFPLRNDVARHIDEVVGRLPRRLIRPGMPVFRSDLSEPFQVQRGELVQVTAIFGAAQLETEALAENSGRQGDVIALRNPGSGKTFRARVEGRDRVLVMPGPVTLLPRIQ